VSTVPAAECAGSGRRPCGTSIRETCRSQVGDAVYVFKTAVNQIVPIGQWVPMSDPPARAAEPPSRPGEWA
jgi:hypothetical protein